MTHLDLANALDLTAWSYITPEDAAAKFREIREKDIQSLLGYKGYPLKCLNCQEEFNFVGEDLLDAMCNCGSFRLQRI